MAQGAAGGNRGSRPGWLAALLILALLLQSSLALTAPLDRAVGFDPHSALCAFDGHQGQGESPHESGCCTFGCGVALRLPALPATPGIALPLPRPVAGWLLPPPQAGPLPSPALLVPLGARAPPPMG